MTSPADGAGSASDLPDDAPIARSAQPGGGRPGDVLGRRRVFVSGLLLFSAASLLGGFAISQWWLLAARAVQGVGGAAGRQPTQPPRPRRGSPSLPALLARHVITA